MVKLINVYSGYGESQILQGVSLEVQKGRIAALLGRNGMGKSTTLNTIMGLVPCINGKILFEDKNITGLSPNAISGLGIGFVPQGGRIFPSLTVEENLQMGCHAGKRKPALFNITDIYRMFPVLKERAKNRGEQISGGEQQMLALGRALLTNPRLILMDEPFEGLAPEIVKLLYSKILDLKNSGLSILLVDQSIRNALKNVDYLYIMNKGRIVYEGPPSLASGEESGIERYMSV